MSDKLTHVAANIARAHDAIQAAQVAVRVVNGTLAEVLAARLQMRMRMRALRAARWCRWTLPDDEQLDDWSETLVAKRQALREEYERVTRDGDQAAADFTLRLRAHASEIEDFEAVVEFALLARLDRN